jgi:alpha-1,6-mannosyltransferase
MKMAQEAFGGRVTPTFDDPERGARTVSPQKRAVLMLGAASAVLYAIAAITQRRWLDDSADADASISPLEVVVFVIATLLVFALFAALLRRFRSEPPSRDARILAIAFPVAFNALLVFVPPSTSIDLLSYISHGYIATELDGNPHLDPSSGVAQTPLGAELVRYGWRPVHPASPYGPLWTRVEAAAVRVVDGVGGQLVALKLIVVAASLGSALLIWKILGDVRPEHQFVGTLAYLWNPLIVVEVAAEGHNDSLMVFFVLLALLLTIRRRASSGIGAMFLGVLTKYVPLLFMPIQLLYSWRTRASTTRFAKQIAAGVIAAAILATVLFGGLWAGSRTFDAVRAAAEPGFSGSTRTMVELAFSRIGSGTVEAIVDVAVIIAFAVFIGVVAWFVEGKDDLLRACAIVSLAYLFVASPSYWPWYAVLPVALLAVAPMRHALLLLFVVSLGSRLAAPLDLLFVDGAFGRRVYFTATWVLAIGLPLTVAVLVHLRRSTRLAAGSSTA